MRDVWSLILVAQRALMVLALLGLSSGCSSTKDTIAAGIGGVAFLAHSPTDEIEQIYYLGVFDPQEQVPPTVYRVRVRGQASPISFTRFASGWVKADLIDSLGTSIGFEKGSESVKITKTGDDLSASLQTGRRLMLFGPEGFREAPKDHRLVIVMGSNPEGFFRAIDESLGVISQAKMEQQGSALNRISQAKVEQQDSALNRLLLEELARLKKERESLDDLVKDVEADMPERKGVD